MDEKIYIDESQIFNKINSHLGILSHKGLFEMYTFQGVNGKNSVFGKSSA